MLKLVGVETFYGKLKVLHGISFEVPPGDIVAMIGANGAGKSTLLNTISAITPADYGEIFFENYRIDQLDPDQIVKRGISQVPQGRRVFPELTVTENLVMGAFTRKSQSAKDQSYEWVLMIFPVLKARLGHKAKHLSGGEQQMLAIGRALMANPKLLLLDEPSMGLAPLVTKEIFQIIRQINTAGTTILLVEQNARQALNIANYAYVLMLGSIDMHGFAKDLLKNEEVQESYLGEGKYTDRKKLWEGKATIRR
jgi:branched-chain amino acid transport system ATP-binding protein